MDKKFIEDFVKNSKEIYESGEKFVWPIPKGASKYKGDYGLLPEDEDIRSWQIPPSSAMLLRFFMLATKSKIVLELGASVGYSTIWLGLAAKENDGHVYTTEILKDKAEIAKKNFKKAGVEDNITLYEKPIFEVLETWPKDRKIDFVFMDADKQNYGEYLKLMYPLLSDHAIIVVDNVGDYPEHMEEFLKQTTTIEDAATYMLEIDHGMFLFVKGGGANLMPLLADELPLFQSKTLKVLMKEKELANFWEKYIQKKVSLRADVILDPILDDLLKDVKGKEVLIMEWGPGRLANDLARRGAIVTKVDLESQKNAFKKIKRPDSITYMELNEFLDKKEEKGKYDIVISYMFNLYLPKDKFVDATKKTKEVMKDGGVFIYSDIQPFRAIVKSKVERGVIALHNPFHANYLQFSPLKAKLRASNGDSLLSEYNRYPMSFLVNVLSESGLKIDKLYEPVPQESDLKKYPVLFTQEDIRIPPYIIMKIIK
ncbi:MAG: hypothetical protein GXP44_01940 [bacterium]|nr:hypothetical protein [bacterium]